MSAGGGDSGFGRTMRVMTPGTEVFGRYVLERVLGRGGMGVVWLAQDRELSLPVALKFVPEEVAFDKRAVADLKEETRRSLKLTHPNIVRIYDFVSDGARTAIAMEYVEGQSLSDLAAEREQSHFDVTEVSGWVGQIASALIYAHEKAGVVHRDLKPANVLVTVSGEVKVADFGVARSLGESFTRLSRQGPGATEGSLPYMSPQQLHGRPPAASDDVYSLGATIYELLTGRPPFYTGDLRTQIEKIDPPSLRERRRELGFAEGGAEISRAWEAGIAACLAKDLAARPGSVRDALEMLEGRGATQAKVRPALPPPLPPPASRPPRRRAAGTGTGRGRGAAGVIATLIGLAAVGVGTWYWANGGFSRAGGDELAEESPAAVTAAAEPIASAPARQPPPPAEPEPYVNSLGMTFVPVPGTDILMCTTETTVAQYEAAGLGYRAPDFPQAEDHPAVNVSWDDAVAWCAWLSAKEGRAYRLPTDHEWSCAVGIGDEEDAAQSPRGKGGKIAGYPWGSEWPPPSGAGNFGAVEGYTDDHEYTSPVGSYEPNGLGIHDLGGNAWEWCEDWLDADEKFRVLRGASWNFYNENFLVSSCRNYLPPATRNDPYGFRCVLALTTSVREPARPVPIEGVRAGDVMTNGIGMVLAWCPPGEFVMGSPDGEEGRDDDEAQHRVALSDGFWLGKHEVTQGEWIELMGTSLADQASQSGQDDPETTVGAESGEIAMYHVNWDEAVEFCRRLTERERRAGRLPGNFAYMLPTESQWEYACRAGTTGPIHTGRLTILGQNHGPELDAIAWYAGNSSEGYEGPGWGTDAWPEKQYPGGMAGPRRVGRKEANGWGLCDMIGNVWEWTGDRYGAYSMTQATDPEGPSTGDDRVTRGGAWSSFARGCRAAFRVQESPSTRNNYLGFRVALRSVD